MTDSEFWRDLEVRFAALQPSVVPIDPGLSASWTSGVWNQTGAQWLLSASDPQVKEQFISLAEEAAAKYGRTRLIQNADERWKLGGGAALFFWLDVLKRESGKYKSDHGSICNADGSDAQGERGRINRLCEASAVYCGKLARRGAASAESELPLPGFKEAIRIGRQARSEIKQYAEDRFDVVRDDILAEYAEQRKQVLAQVRRTGNSGGYLPARVRLEAEHVRKMILAMAEAYVEAFTLYSVPSDRQAERDLQTAAQQIAGGSISGIRGDLQLRSKRLRTAEEGLGVPWHLEIERAMNTALRKGVLRLRRQRITCKPPALSKSAGGSNLQHENVTIPAVTKPMGRKTPLAANTAVGIMRTAMIHQGLNPPNVATKVRAVLSRRPGRKLKVDRTTIYRILNGRTKRPNPTLRNALIKVLELSAEDAGIAMRELAHAEDASVGKKLTES